MIRDFVLECWAFMCIVICGRCPYCRKPLARNHIQKMLYCRDCMPWLDPIFDLVDAAAERRRQGMDR